MQQQQLVSYFFIGLFLFILYQLVLILSPFFTAIFLAGMLAFAFHPLYQRILALPKLNQSTSAICTTALVALIVIIPAATVIVSLMQEAVGLYQYVSRWILEGQFEPAVEKIRQFMAIEWVTRITTMQGLTSENITDFFLRAARIIGNFSTIQLAYFTKNLVLWVFTFFVMTILLFFFFRDGQHMHELFFGLLPLSDKNRKVISKKLNETFAAVIRGQLATSFVQAFLTGITFWALDLPLPFFFGFLAFLASLIPVTGAATIWVPFTIYLFAAQDIVKGIILLAIGTFVISMSDNVLKPILIGEKTKLPVFLLFLGILGGLNLYGFTGVFVGPVVISLFFALLDIYREDYRTKT